MKKQASLLTIIGLLILANTVSAQAKKQDPAKKPAATAETKAEEKAPAQPVAGQPANNPPAKTEPTEDPALSNDKDMLPNGHFAHRVATPKEEKLSFIGRVQMRAMSGQGDTFWSSPGTDYGLVDFNFRRLRMGMIYNGSDAWGLIVHLRLENALNREYITTSTRDCGTAAGNALPSGTNCVTSVTLNDNRGIIQEANLWYNFNFMRTRITFGMIAVPFSREYLTSSANLINIERSMGTNAAQQFDNGLMIQFNPLKSVDKTLDRYLTVAAMVGTGHGGNGDFGYGRRVDMAQSQGNSNVTYSPFFYGRIQGNVLGGLKRGTREVGWQDNEEVFQKEMKLSIGAGMMGSKETKINNNNLPEFTPRTTSVISSNAAPYTALTAGTGSGPCASGKIPNGETCNLIGYTADATWTWNHIYVNGMYNFYAGNASNNISGYTITAGYNIPVYGLSYLMPVLRYDFMKGNFLPGSVSEAQNQVSMIWAGLNLFHDKHLFKLQLFYAININKQNYDAATATYGSYRQNLIIFQAQATFWTGADIANKPANTDL